jgi:lysophospholipid acyltransferase (LPLAT)-like uncharacterized protein
MWVMLQTVVLNSGGHNLWILKSWDKMRPMPMSVRTVTILGSYNYMVRNYSTVALCW